MKKFDRITLKDIFGRTIEIKGTIISEKTHGYNLPSGAWSLYPIEDDCTPATFIIFRRYRMKKLSTINKNIILAINGKAV